MNERALPSTRQAPQSAFIAPRVHQFWPSERRGPPQQVATWQLASWARAASHLDAVAFDRPRTAALSATARRSAVTDPNEAPSRQPHSTRDDATRSTVPRRGLKATDLVSTLETAWRILQGSGLGLMTAKCSVPKRKQFELTTILNPTGTRTNSPTAYSKNYHFWQKKWSHQRY